MFAYCTTAYKLASFPPEMHILVNYTTLLDIKRMNCSNAFNSNWSHAVIVTFIKEEESLATGWSGWFRIGTLWDLAGLEGVRHVGLLGRFFVWVAITL